MPNHLLEAPEISLGDEIFKCVIITVPLDTTTSGRVMLSSIAAAYDRWQPTIGDPHVVGWVTVGAYFLAAVLCYVYAHSMRRDRIQLYDRGHQIFWLMLAVVMLALAINKQLDLQTLLTKIGREHAKTHEWYENRRSFQIRFIYTAMVAGVLVGLALLALTWRQWRRNALALAGLTLVGTFVVVRAASFHSVDILIGTEIAGIRVNWILELGGITLIVCAATLNILRDRISAATDASDPSPASGRAQRDSAPH